MQSIFFQAKYFKTPVYVLRKHLNCQKCVCIQTSQKYARKKICFSYFPTNLFELILGHPVYTNASPPLGMYIVVPEFWTSLRYFQIEL